MKITIPEAALSQHIAILGKTGSGKTYAAKGVAEGLLDVDARVCIIDPTGAWHGLRSSATGKSAGYPVVIFGGTHADLPLGAAHGEAIAEIIGTSSTPAIIDTSQMRVGERTRFFADFADALIRKNRGPLHLVIDEAHLFAPQGKVNDPQSGAMLHAANNLVSLGRSRGLRIMLITQRPAKLHKDSLTQVETLVALRLIAPQDRKAVEEWIKDNADQDKGREIISSLATLKTGQAWIWAPEIGVLERVAFPKIRTFDSSKAPEAEASGSGPVLAPIDREAIAARLQTVAADALANDPARLKARIRELEAHAKKANGVALSASDVAAAEERGYQHGLNVGQQEIEQLRRSMRSAVMAAVEAAFKQEPAIQALAPTARPAPTPAPKKVVVSVPSGDLSGPEQRIVDAIAWLESTTGKEEQEQTAVAFMANYAYGAGSFNNPKGSLNGKGLVQYVPGNKIKLTDDGRTLARVPDEALTNDELHRRVLGRLPGPEQRVLKPLLDAYPEPVDGPELAAAAGYAFGAGSFNNPRGRLRSLGLVEYVGNGQVVASECLFPS
jgi:hypothetical protein